MNGGTRTIAFWNGNCTSIIAIQHQNEGRDGGSMALVRYGFIITCLMSGGNVPCV